MFRSRINWKQVLLISSFTAAIVVSG